jgi:hypothetical protein
MVLQFNPSFKIISVKAYFMKWVCIWTIQKFFQISVSAFTFWIHQSFQFLWLLCYKPLQDIYLVQFLYLADR